MRDKDLYGRILGIEAPWKVVEVELRLEDEGEVMVFLKHGSPKDVRCPECGKEAPGYDTRSSSWRHLDTCQYRTILVADVPRIDCPEHGVRQIRVPWSEAGSRFTALFEALVIDWLREASIAAVSRRLGLSWKAVSGVMDRAVERGLARRKARLPARIGVDETSYQKRHEYVTVVLDQEGSEVVHVADGKGRAALDGFFEKFTQEEREQVESVSMDMSASYIASTKDWIPEAGKKIAFDRFHVAQHLGQAVDKVRRQENKALASDGDNRLKGTKYLWLQSPDALNEERWEHLDALRNASLKTARAWAIKELASTLWTYRSRGWARKAWLRWYDWAIRSRLEPIKKAARMVKKNLDGILNATVMGVTNARSEAINAKIQWIKYTAYLNFFCRSIHDMLTNYPSVILLHSQSYSV